MISTGFSIRHGQKALKQDPEVVISEHAEQSSHSPDCKQKKIEISREKSQEWTVEEAYAQYGRDIFKLILCRVENRQTAEDLLQETFIKVLEHKNQLNDVRNLRQWIRRIAENEIKMHYRKQDRSVATVTTAPDDEGYSVLEIIADLRANVEQQMFYTGDIIRLRKAFAQMAEQEQRLLSLRFYEEKSFQEIGQLMGVAMDTAKRRVDRAKDKLERIYKEMERNGE